MTRRWLGLALVTMLALAGCGGMDDGDSGGGESAADQAAPEEAAGREAPPQDDAGDDGAAGELVVTERAVIYTGEITVRVADVDRAAGDAGAVAERYGGFVGGDERTTDEDYSTAHLELRIPSENFYAAVSDLAGLGDEEWRAIHTEDVTSEVVDLETRIATAEASMARTRALLEEADSITDIVAIEKELTDREETLGRLQARQQTLAELTTLSTIRVALLGPEAEEEPEPSTGFVAGLRAGWDAFVTSATVLVTVVGALLPFLVTIGVPVGAAWWWTRRRRRARLVTPEETTP